MLSLIVRAGCQIHSIVLLQTLLTCASLFYHIRVTLSMHSQCTHDALSTQLGVPVLTLVHHTRCSHTVQYQVAKLTGTRECN
jgi:hypothetical protein